MTRKTRRRPVDRADFDRVLSLLADTVGIVDTELTIIRGLLRRRVRQPAPPEKKGTITILPPKLVSDN
jgi:hypothetical protein